MRGQPHGAAAAQWAGRRRGHRVASALCASRSTPRVLLGCVPGGGLRGSQAGRKNASEGGPKMCSDWVSQNSDLDERRCHWRCSMLRSRLFVAPGESGSRRSPTSELCEAKAGKMCLLAETPRGMTFIAQLASLLCEERLVAPRHGPVLCRLPRRHPWCPSTCDAALPLCGTTSCTGRMLMCASGDAPMTRALRGRPLLPQRARARARPAPALLASGGSFSWSCCSAFSAAVRPSLLVE